MKVQLAHLIPSRSSSTLPSILSRYSSSASTTDPTPNLHQRHSSEKPTTSNILADKGAAASLLAQAIENTQQSAFKSAQLTRRPSRKLLADSITVSPTSPVEAEPPKKRIPLSEQLKIKRKTSGGSYDPDARAIAELETFIRPTTTVSTSPPSRSEAWKTRKTTDASITTPPRSTRTPRVYTPRSTEESSSSSPTSPSPQDARRAAYMSASSRDNEGEARTPRSLKPRSKRASPRAGRKDGERSSRAAAGAVPFGFSGGMPSPPLIKWSKIDITSLLVSRKNEYDDLLNQFRGRVKIEDLLKEKDGKEGIATRQVIKQEVRGDYSRWIGAKGLGGVVVGINKGRGKSTSELVRQIVSLNPSVGLMEREKLFKTVDSLC